MFYVGDFVENILTHQVGEIIAYGVGTGRNRGRTIYEVYDKEENIHWEASENCLRLLPDNYIDAIQDKLLEEYDTINNGHRNGHWKKCNKR